MDWRFLSISEKIGKPDIPTRLLFSSAYSIGTRSIFAQCLAYHFKIMRIIKTARHQARFVPALSFIFSLRGMPLISSIAILLFGF